MRILPAAALAAALIFAIVVLPVWICGNDRRRPM